MGKLIDFDPLDGNVIFNWESLPDKISGDTQLRDAIWKDVQSKYGDEPIMDSKLLFEINKYVINRINSKIR